MKIRILYFTLLLLYSGFVLRSQSGTLRGHVYDAQSGSPLISANLQLMDTNTGTITDVNGFYFFTNVPPGDYNLVATYVGYDSISVPVKISPNTIIYKSLTMTESSVQLSEVSISSSREKSRSTVNISQISVTGRQIKTLPSVGGESDIAQYLQVLPGVISTGDQGGQIYIRGGSPIQNKILLDGLNIFNPFHSVGFYSVFETELIKNTEVYTGGFGAEYGGRISAIVDITTREGNKKRMSGFLSGGPFMVKGLIEGPLKKFKEGGSSISYVMTAKKSLIENSSKSLYKYAATNDSVGLPFSFSDYYGKLSFNGANGSKVNIFGFNYQDKYANPALAKIDWTNTGGGANFVLIPSGSDIIIDGLVGFTKYNSSLQEKNDQPRTSAIDEISAQLNFSLFGNKSELKYGLDLRSLRTDFEFVNPFGIRIIQEQNTTEMGLFGKYKRIFGQLIAEPSMRIQYYSSLGTITFEPRLGLKYNISNDLRLKFSGGRYTQNLLSTSNERDVVNLFNGFLTGPESQVLGLDNNVVKNKLQISHHAIVGVEYDLSKKIKLNAEAYYKDFPQLIVVNRNKTQRSQPDYSVETGSAYGAELSIKYEIPKVYVWTTYSYGFVNRYDGQQTYPTIFDRRHNANVLLTYTPDRAATWQISGRWNLGSGFPFTKTKAFYNHIDFLSGPDTDYETTNPNNVGIVYSDVRNGGRLPYYHRLDISVQKKIIFSKYTSLELNLSVTNAYNRENIFYFDRIRYERVNQLPFLPSVGAKINF
ncbi:MAG: TonB-dependent receptor [Saprospiraceae bacterium]